MGFFLDVSEGINTCILAYMYKNNLLQLENTVLGDDLKKNN